jgi:hypothetical protein
LAIAANAALDGWRAASFQCPREKRTVRRCVALGWLEYDTELRRGELLAKLTPAGAAKLAELRGEPVDSVQPATGPTVQTD